MVTHEELVEKVARRLFECGYLHASEGCEIKDRLWDEWGQERARSMRQAKAAIATILEALNEPTPEMMEALWSMRMSNTKESFTACLQAMLEASPLVEEERR